MLSDRLMRTFLRNKKQWLGEKLKLSSAVTFGFIAIAMLWAGIINNFHNDAQAEFANTQRIDHNFAILFEQNVLRSLGEADKALLHMRDKIGVRTGTADLQAVVSGSAVVSEIIIQVAIIDAKGILRASNVDVAPPKPIDLSQREHFKAQLVSETDSLFISQPMIGRASNKWSIQLSRRLTAPDGVFAGVVVASLDPDHFSAMYNHINLGKETAIALIGSDGVVRSSGGLLGPSHYPLGRQIRETELYQRMLLKNDGSFVELNRETGRDRLHTFRKVRGYPLWVDVSIAEEGIFQEARADFLKLSLAGIMLTIIMLIAMYRIWSANVKSELKSYQLLLTLKHMDQGLMLVMPNLSVPVLNEKCAELLGLPTSFVTAPPRFDEILAYMNLLGELDTIQRPPGVSELEFFGPSNATHRLTHYQRTRPNGIVLDVRTSYLPEGGFVRVFSDITQRQRAQNDIARLAAEDALTGLANRRSFAHHLTITSRHSVQLDSTVSCQVEYAVLVLDLDHFKAVNDTLGHPVGDKLLQAVALRLKSSIRTNDFIARLGGDEFAIILTHVDNREEVSGVADRLIATISAPFEIDGHQISMGVSIGVALGPIDAADTTDLLVAADLALYAAKGAGRCTKQFYSAEMHEQAQLRREIETDLRAGIDDNQLTLHAQPIVNLKRNTITGFEALVRWRHPTKGMISPLDFIPIAEETGLIVPLGDWVLRQACRAAKTWPQHISIAVNLSPVQFTSPTLVSSIEAILAETGLPAHRLELEITERILMQDSAANIATLRQIKQLGVRIAMDDFGTGYSSLSYLQSFPFDKIKVDRSFVAELGQDRSTNVIVTSVINIARARGMTTTAEGVETLSQLHQLSALGCDEAQGYLLSRPLPIEQAADLVATWVAPEKYAA